MTSTDDKPPSIAERYLTARNSADTLLAAAFAQAGNLRGTMALTLYRVAEDRRERLVVEVPSAEPPRTLPHDLVALHDWAVPELRRWAGRGRGKPMTRTQASHIAERVLRWWCSDSCQACNGRGYQLLPGTQIRSDTLCPECNGTDERGREYQGMGRPPVERRLKKSQREAGRWLASEFSAMLAMVLSEMAARLKPSLDVNLERWPDITGRLEELRSAVAQED